MLDDGKAYLRAEARLLELKSRPKSANTGKRRCSPLRRRGFALAALVALSVTLVIGFAHWMGPFGGGLLAVAIFAAGAFGLAFAAKRFVGRIDD